MEAPDIFQLRPPFNVGAVFLDLDGTCLDVNQDLDARTEDAIRAAAQKVPIILATGRMYQSALRWSERLLIDQPLICYQGALVRDVPHRGGKVLLNDPLEFEQAFAAIMLARRRGWHRQAFVDDTLLCEEDRPEAHLYARIAHVPITFVEDLEPWIEDDPTAKVVFVIEDPDEVERALTEARTLLRDNARVTSSLPQMVEIVSPTAGKGRAAKAVCKRLTVDISTTVAVGDAPNDVDMLKAVGFGVAVRPVHPELSRLAKATCASARQAGVADVLAACSLI